MLECLICHEEYNYSQNLPKTLPDCGHTICSACLTKILSTRKCPECRKGFSFNVPTDARQFQTNVALQRIIETMTSFCKEHQSPLTQICLTDKVKVCINCVKYDGHKHHIIKSIESVKAEAKKKIQEYEKLERELEESAKQELEFLLNSQNEILQMVREGDSSDLEMIDDKRDKYLWQIESLFAEKRSEYKAKTANRVSYNEKVTHLKEILEEEGQITQEYLQALEENIEYPPIEDEAILKEFLQNSAKEIESVILPKVEILKASSPKPFGRELLESHDSKTTELAVSLEVLRWKYFDINFINRHLLTICPQHPSQLSKKAQENSFFDIQNELERVDSLTIQHNHIQLSDEMIDGIHYIWKSLPSPISVGLDFKPEAFTRDNLFSCLKYPCWKAGALKAFSIKSEQCQINNNFLKFLESCGQRIPDLAHFSLSLNETDMTDALLEALLKLIPLLFKNLQRLALSLAKNKITQKSIANLFLFLQELTSLQNFSLDISETRIGETGLDTLFQGLHHLENYKELSLSLGSLPLQEKHIDLLTQKCFKSIHLKKLMLSFDSTHLDVANIEKICYEIPKQLSALNLSFSRTKIASENILTLANSLAAMPNLSSLDLNIKDTQVADESVMALCETFSKNTTILQELKLNFYNIPISEQTLRFMLTEIIPRISTLVKFHIQVKENFMSQEIRILIDQINKKYE